MTEIFKDSATFKAKSESNPPENNKRAFICFFIILLERVTGIEPVSYPWEGYVLPLNYTRINNHYSLILLTNSNKFNQIF